MELDRTESTIVVGTAPLRDETGLEWTAVVVASELGDAVFDVVASHTDAARRAADALADDVVEKLSIVVGGRVERGEVDQP